MIEPWCVLLASRVEPRVSKIPSGRSPAAPHAGLDRRNPLAAAARRAATVASRDRIAAVTAGPSERVRQNTLKEFGIRNLFVQPKHQGTAYEVLLALLILEGRVSAATPVLFLPTDHVVEDEDGMTKSLVSMAEWIAHDPRPVYLLGAKPQGPHDQLGYVVPWHHSMIMPAGVYEFVERPDVSRARSLISDGGLWNTFIFGGNIAALFSLFRPRFDKAILALRAALLSDPRQGELARAYDGLPAVDFSHDVLARKTDNLAVLRLLSCGWWPLKSPALSSSGPGATPSRLNIRPQAPLE